MTSVTSKLKCLAQCHGIGSKPTCKPGIADASLKKEIPMAAASHTDLLIIGAGPAGLMAACWAAQYDMSTRIIDEKSGRTRTGHADGIHSRTLEILESFGVVDPILRQGVHDVEMCYWVC